MRLCWVLWCSMLLPGCLPAPVVLASYAADGGSYAATGKTVADHGISAATLRDCSVLRIFKGQEICVRESPSSGIAVEDRRRTRAGSAPGRFVIVGSFAERGNADREAQRLAPYRASVVPATLGDRVVHRVVLGPLDETQIAALKQSGDADFWGTR